MGESLVGIVGIVIGTMLGFALSEFSSRKREQRIDRRESAVENSRVRNIRAMLLLEADNNIAGLREFYDTAVKTADSFPGENKNTSYARRIVELPFPTLSHKVWENHLSDAPKSLSTKEIEKVFALHNHLDHIALIRSELIDLHEQQRQMSADFQTQHGSQISARHLGAYANTKVFDRRAPELWTAWETEILRNVFDKGNPIE